MLTIEKLNLALALPVKGRTILKPLWQILFIFLFILFVCIYLFSSAYLKYNHTDCGIVTWDNIFQQPFIL